MSGMNTSAAGMLLEMQLARERDRELRAELGDEKVSIVDQSQFRNVQINEGYQHKKVVRQRGTEQQPPSGKVRDMTVEGRQKAAERKKRRDHEEALADTKRKRIQIAPGVFATMQDTQAAEKVAKKHRKEEKKERKREKKEEKKERKREKKERKREKKTKKEKEAHLQHGAEGEAAAALWDP